MNDRSGTEFEGMVRAKLSGLEERLDEVLSAVRGIEERCMAEHAARAGLAAEVRALREKTDFNLRVIWSAVAWIVVAAAGLLLAALGVGR